MKSILTLFALTFIINAPILNSNEFKVDKISYQTNFGYYENYGSNESGSSTNFDVHLMSVEKDMMDKKFDYVLLDINSLDGEKISSGVYNFSNSKNKDFKALTFNSASVLIDYDANNHSGTVFFAVNGKVEVKKKKGKYTLKYELLLEDNTKVTGYYEGPLTAWDQGI